MTAPLLGPLRFDPIFQYRLWGGRRLGDWMDATLPDGPIGEAWILSDRKDHASVVAEGPMQGRTITDLMTSSKAEILGLFADRFDRFPLLLKFLDVEQMLSVQVHPRDDQKALIPEGDTGKTEAWIVLEADKGARIYAGLKPHTTADDLRTLTTQTVDDHLASFQPAIGQAVEIEAGTVHSLGDGVMVFEAQENSDVTFRLYDWDHVDKTTGKKRDLQVEQAIDCVDFDQGAIRPAAPHAKPGAADRDESLIDNRHFRVRRIDGKAPFDVGAANKPRILVAIAGEGAVQAADGETAMRRGSVVLLPACLGRCRFKPAGEVSMLEIAIAG